MAPRSTEHHEALPWRRRLLLVQQPPRGVDVGAFGFIRQPIVDLSRSGEAVLNISGKLDELLEIRDRLIVICQGRVSAPHLRNQINREEIGLLMTRLDHHAKTEGAVGVAVQN